jgi:hypothetical protein
VTVIHATNTANTMSEVVYTSNELARARKLHPSTVRKIFVREPGVIRLGHPRSSGRRQRFTLRIPESVAERVFSRMTVRDADA